MLDNKRHKWGRRTWRSRE